jgi:molybdenum cofactor synthesis domain-containing protein
MFSAAVITISDKGAAGLRTDTAGPACVEILKQNQWDVVLTEIVPDDYDKIREVLLHCADDKINLVVTTGGTGFSHRDVTPEATLSVVQREVRGIPEAMRAESLKITPMGMLSRSVCGIRNESLIVNLPGSEKAAKENLLAVIGPIKHGVEVLAGTSVDCATLHRPSVRAVCISEKKGEQKTPVSSVLLQEDHGIVGDAHAGNWHRQVSLLGYESIQKVQAAMPYELADGAFAENIVTQGITLYTLPIGTKLRIGESLCEVTQIGKECHHGCAIRELAGDCVMPREGIFVKVLKGGTVRSGDAIDIIE